MFFSLIRSIIFLIIVPFLMGRLLSRTMEKYKSSIGMPIMIGYFIEFLLFEFICVPFTFKTTDFSPIFYTWLLAITIISIVSIVIEVRSRDTIKDSLLDIVESFMKLPKLLTIVAIVFVLFQVYMGFRYMHIDNDDSNFVAKATITYQTNTVYHYDDVGNVIPEDRIDARHELAVFPIYIAAVSKVIDVHPAITAHTVFPALFITICYVVYAYIADNLFKKKEKVPIFIIFLSILYMYGAYSADTNFVFLLYRVWQGKALVGNLAIPALWLLYLEYSQSERKNIYYIAMFIVMAGSNLLSSMAVAIMPITMFCLMIVYFIKDRKKIDIIKAGVTVIPCAIMGLTYLLIK